MTFEHVKKNYTEMQNAIPKPNVPDEITIANAVALGAPAWRHCM